MSERSRVHNALETTAPRLGRARLPGLMVGLLVVLGACNQGTTPPPDTPSHQHAATAVTLWTDQTEVFFEYPPMIAGAAGTAWAIHLTRLNDFKPVTEGRLTLRFRRQGGQGFMVRSEAPARPGIFVPAPSLPDPGTYRVIIDVESPELTDRIDAGEIIVYPSEAEVPHEAAVAGDASISFLKEQQWPIDFGVAKAEPREVAHTLSVTGSIHPAAGQMAEVAAPVSGLLLAEANLRAPVAGDPVRQGQTLAVIAPTTGDNSYAEAKARVERLRREVDRLQRLFDAEAIPKQRLLEAQHDLEIADAAFQALGGSTDDGYDYPVRAPLTGVINARQMVPGARVEAGEQLFTIVNPSVVWLRLNLSAQDAAQANAIQEVFFTVEGGAEPFRTRRVVSVGSMLDPDTRTLPVTLAVDNRDRRLKIGLFAEGQAFVQGETSAGLAVPNEAIQREDGQPVVYVQTEGESFERRLLVLGATDGRYTLVERGVEAGEYVVVKGAYQVYLASLGTSEIGDHGHPH